ncbi:hypothetical protein P153DRAFT_303188 [Dothidotthia symphoricarpi CBS 119687]|uniref:Zn(2)-C6 fungal-type domain-containing protein n=1 Tax=Dothidotthia symphoricarpi CBS 119687 TaxID=1392245 RepID=A0A6A6A0J3_9PLEO|nr:uncharacterized protein P153DRAFT_303188 [Dothidotthia symphoricarpi CBS 119687]KAF2124091.1 hypothetical protein P153DRAFT_303188 [Dothidotthia symphoricarpi CBS 119687]
MADTTSPRGTKRARHACLNCRRKKTRCSGERPICAFCSRMQQECVYDAGTSIHPLTPYDVNLAARVAWLESKLGAIDWNSSDNLPPVLSDRPSPDGASIEGRQHDFDMTAHGSDFSCIPDMNILQSATDVYFRLCHNHPYSYFTESDFREKLQERCFPSYLLLSFMAVVARYSDDPFFKGQNALAAERFARTAWSQISDYIFSSDGEADIQTVQATSMLAINDFLFGRHRAASVKTGLCVRLAQTLRLGEQSEYDTWSEARRQESRMTFWSVYLLDKLVSCGRDRPPTILDADCTVTLPTLQKYSKATQTTLSALIQPSESSQVPQLDDFALVVFMASVLGRTVRFSLQRVSNPSYPPWDSRSEFASIYGTLLSFEAFSNSRPHAFDADIPFGYSSANKPEFAQSSHFIFAHVLYHYNQCILHHPFLLKFRLKSSHTRVPPTFLREAIRRNKEHADRLISILTFVQCEHLPISTFYGFCAVISGVIQRLHSATTTQSCLSRKDELFQSCLDFLDHAPHQYVHCKRMSTVLRTLQPNSAYADALMSPLLFPEHLHTQDDNIDELLWNTFDYGWLCDPNRPLEFEHQVPKTSSNSNYGEVQLPESSVGFDYEDWDCLLHIGAGGSLPAGSTAALANHL